MRLLWILSLVLALTGCMSKRQYLRDVADAYSDGLKDGGKESATYKIAYDQCFANLKDVQNNYYRDLGFKLKEQHNARTDK